MKLLIRTFVFSSSVYSSIYCSKYCFFCTKKIINSKISEEFKKKNEFPRNNLESVKQPHLCSSKEWKDMNSCYFLMRLIYTYFQRAHHSSLTQTEGNMHRTFLINKNSLFSHWIYDVRFVCVWHQVKWKTVWFCWKPKEKKQRQRLHCCIVVEQHKN